MTGMTLQEIQQEMEKLDGWSFSSGAIEKVVPFSDFKEAMVFVNRVAEVAEKQEHHPDIMINYNVVRLSLTTHSVKGLTKTDFDVARDIDAIS